MGKKPLSAYNCGSPGLHVFLSELHLVFQKGTKI